MQELYEPLWDELLQQSNKLGFRMRGIWIADVAHQGKSAVLNEDKLGNDREPLLALLVSMSRTYIYSPLSLVARPSQRSASYDQPLSYPDASTIGWYRPQHGGT